MLLKKKWPTTGVPIVAHWKQIQLSINEKAGSIPGLAQWVEGSGIAVSCGLGRRHGSDPLLLWLWRRPEAVILILTLA